MAEPRPSSRSTNAITLRVLLVGGASAERESLLRTFGGDGHDVVMRPPNPASLEDPSADGCDLVVLDLSAGETERIELLARLRRRPGCADRPIVVVVDDPTALDPRITNTIDDLVIAPIRPAELSFRIRALTDARRVKAALLDTARTLAARTRELEAANEARRTIASFLVHDLKNPLQSVALGAHLLVHARSLDPDSKDVVRTISDQADRMKRLVRELLDLERGDGTELVAPLEPLRARVLVEMAESIARAERGRSTIEVVGTNLETTVLANAQLVHRVFVNLIDNAIRYTPRGESVKVAIDRAGDSLRVRIIDRGPGIAAASRSGMFERGTRRASAELRRDDRDGLGLAFCKAALATMSASIEALEGEDRTGSTFEILWPVAGNHRACA